MHATAREVSSLSLQQGSSVLDVEVGCGEWWRRRGGGDDDDGEEPPITRRFKRGHRSMDTSLTIPVNGKYSTYLTWYSIFQSIYFMVHAILAEFDRIYSSRCGKLTVFEVQGWGKT